MGNPYIGEIRMFAGNYAPVGWEFCEGQLLPISQNDVLFQVLRTDYGGDGQDTFALPDLRGRVPVHNGNGKVLGQAGGVEDHVLGVNQIPNHTHPLLASTNQGTLPDPGNHVPARSSTAGVFLYVNDSPDVTMNAASIAPVGGSQPHTNVQPYLCFHFIISLYGVFPSET